MENVETVKFNNNGEEIDLQLTEEFTASLDILEKTNNSLFITGKAGCGKSTLLKYFVSQTDKNVNVLAFTGLAAINVGGETIHSFFKFPLGFLEIAKIKPKEMIKKKLQAVDVIIIDEVSMVRADMIDAIDKSLQVNRESNEPFGGVQMIFIGDLFQLPPIVGNDIKEVYNQYYGTPYFFSAEIFKHYRLPYVNLEKIHRQTDQTFIDILNSVRECKNLHEAIPQLNQRVKMDLNDIRHGETVALTTTNAKSKEINDYFLKKLDAKEYTYRSSVTGEFEKNSYPTDEKLTLKVGSKVMFIRNNKEEGYVNGDVGIVEELGDNHIVVKKNDMLYPVQQVKWEKTKYEYIQPEEEGEKGSIEKKVVGIFKQYPLKLAWSITIHKSQGQTYNKVFIDFHNGTFTSGQSYVALSRCRNLEGLTMKREMTTRDVILDHRINQFYNMFENIIQ